MVKLAEIFELSTLKLKVYIVLDIVNRLMDMGSREERVRCMERVTCKLNITVCKIHYQWGFAVCVRKLQQGLCIKLEGWDGEGIGSEVQKGGDIGISMADSCCGLTENSKIL